MTAKRKDTGEEFDLKPGGYDRLLRHAILVAALSASPFGQQILKNMGVSGPSTEQVAGVKVQVEAMAKEVDNLKGDVKGVKDDIKNVNEKVSELSGKIQGFKVDWDKYRKTDPQ